MGKITKYFLLTDSIEEIDLCVAGIEMHFYPHLIFHLGYFNVVKSVLYVEKLPVSQLNILNKSIMIRKRGLVTITPNIRTNQVMEKTYNAR